MGGMRWHTQSVVNGCTRRDHKESFGIVLGEACSQNPGIHRRYCEDSDERLASHGLVDRRTNTYGLPPRATQT